MNLDNVLNTSGLVQPRHQCTEMPPYNVLESVDAGWGEERTQGVAALPMEIVMGGKYDGVRGWSC
jgi:hypothetical protein